MKSIRQMDKGNARFRISSVRTQPRNVIAASFGASPAKILRTLNVLLSMHRDYHQSLVKSQLSRANTGSSCYGIKRHRPPASLLHRFPVVESGVDCLKISGLAVVRMPLNRSPALLRVGRGGPDLRHFPLELLSERLANSR